MRFIGYGNLNLEYFFKDDILTGLSCGTPSFNILANMKEYNTKFYASVGSDFLGDVLINLANKYVTNTEIFKEECSNDLIFYKKSGYTLECPNCHRKTNEENEFHHEIELLNDDVLIVDRINEYSNNLINKASKSYLYLNHLGDLFYMGLDEIEEEYKEKFEIIYFTDKTYNLLRNKFSIDSVDIFNILSPKVLIVGKGINGFDIVYEDGYEKKEVEEFKNLNSNHGVNECLFAEFIKNYLNTSKLNEKTISKIFMKSISTALYASTFLGNKEHLYPLSNIKEYKECICRDIKL